MVTSSPRPTVDRLRHSGAVIIVGLLVLAALAGDSALHPPAAQTVGEFRLAVAPAKLTVQPGGTATYRVEIDRGRFPDSIGLSVTGLPRGARAPFRPARTRDSSTQLTVRKSASTTPFGTRRLTVRGRALFRLAQSTAVLVIARPAPATGTFTISGRLAVPMYPGTGGPVNLLLANAAPRDISVTGLSMTVSEVQAPNVRPGLPSNTADFAVDQFSGGQPLRVAALAAQTLGDLDVPVAQMPVLRMRNTTTNQDDCQKATIFLAYTGTAEPA